MGDTLWFSASFFIARGFVVPTRTEDRHQARLHSPGTGHPHARGIQAIAPDWDWIGRHNRILRDKWQAVMAADRAHRGGAHLNFCSPSRDSSPRPSLPLSLTESFSTIHWARGTPFVEVATTPPALGQPRLASHPNRLSSKRPLGAPVFLTFAIPPHIGTLGWIQTPGHFGARLQGGMCPFLGPPAPFSRCFPPARSLSGSSDAESRPVGILTHCHPRSRPSSWLFPIPPLSPYNTPWIVVLSYTGAFTPIALLTTRDLQTVKVAPPLFR